MSPSATRRAVLEARPTSRFSAALLGSALLLLATACSTSTPAAAPTQPPAAASPTTAATGTRTMAVGFFPGPYADQFKRGVQPVLEKQGYKINATEFSNAIQPNTAVMDGSLDVNIFQNDAFMSSFNSANGGDIVDVLKIPSAPLGLYSSKYKSLDEAKSGAKVSLPNDPTNLARAMVFLQSLGLFKIKDGVDPTKATEKDVGDNPQNIQLVPLDAPNIPRALSDVDFGAALGNHVLAANMLLSDAIKLETPAPQYFIIIATRTGNADKQNVKDLVAAYQSPDFKAFVASDPQAKGFAIPADWK